MQGGVGMGRVGSKKSKPNLDHPRGAKLKSCPIPTPPPLQGGGKPAWGEAKRGGSSGARQDKIFIPMPGAHLN